MENGTKYRYRIKPVHILATFAVLTLAMCVAAFTAERIPLLIFATLAIYVIAVTVRDSLSEKAVYITDTYLSVPRTNQFALRTLTGGSKNIRIPSEAIIEVATSSNYNQEYLHIWYGDEVTTLVSSMFESKDLFEQFKEQLHARSKQIEVAGSGG